MCVVCAQIGTMDILGFLLKFSSDIEQISVFKKEPQVFSVTRSDQIMGFV